MSGSLHADIRGNSSGGTSNDSEVVEYEDGNFHRFHLGLPLVPFSPGRPVFQRFSLLVPRPDGTFAGSLYVPFFEHLAQQD